MLWKDYFDKDTNSYISLKYVKKSCWKFHEYPSFFFLKALSSITSLLVYVISIRHPNMLLLPRHWFSVFLREQLEIPSLYAPSFSLSFSFLFPRIPSWGDHRVPNCNPVVGEAAALSPISWMLRCARSPKRGGTSRKRKRRRCCIEHRVYARRAKKCKYDKRPRPKFKRSERESAIGEH